MKTILFLSLVGNAVGGSLLRGGNTASNHDNVRELMATHKHFERLPCNDNIGVCETWSSQSFDTSSQVVIPCDKCIALDVTGLLTLSGGLDIQGKLVIPDELQVEIHTPHVLVQGELEMNSSRATSGEEDVKFVMTGTSNVELAPHAHNTMACNMGTCNFGVKPFAVAGGLLNIQGLPQSCPSWTNLKSVQSIGTPDSVNLPTYVQPAAGCSDDLVPPADFEGNLGISWPSGWYRNYGGTDSYETDENGNTYALYGGRTSTWNGPQTNFDASCVVPGVTYFLQARARLTKPGGISNCQATGSNCLKLTSFMEDSDIGKRWNGRSSRSPVARDDGVWYDFVSTFTFLEKDADATTALARRLYWEGPEAGVEIALDDIRIFRAPASTFPSPDNLGDVCQELIQNGDVEDTTFGIIPYPFTAANGDLQVATEPSNGNRYYTLTNRAYTWASPKYILETNCVQPQAVYSFSVDIRVHSSSTQKLRWEVKAVDASGSPSWSWIAQCPEQSSADGWVTCAADWQWTDFQGTATRLELYAVSFDSGYQDVLNDIDFDNFSFSFSSGPVRSLVLPDASIASCWGVGSEILVTSNNLNFEDVQTRTIASITPNESEDTVTIELNEAMTVTSSLDSEPDYAVEVALLSRNIVLAGADTALDQGGHLIIHHTDRPQLIDGIAVKQFGQQGNLGRYPIHFHMCGSAQGSIVSRNLVRDSFQRCYVIHGSHNITLDSNVAYETFGHCFMLEDSAEQDNVWQDNLSAVTRKVTTKISSAETDDLPSSFWITNPSNTFIGNVAAGSEHSGFWFEMKDAVRGPSAMLQNMDGSLVYQGYKPSEAPLGVFADNVAHSNWDQGLRTYPGRGYIPIETAVFTNTKCYRNRGNGVFFHNSYNLKIDGGVFADNRIQIDVDRSPSCSVDGAKVIGYSPEYRYYAESMNAWSHCPSSYPLRGIEIHSYWTGGTKYSGTTVENVDFQNFGNTGCADSTAIRVDPEDKGYFDVRSSVTNISLDAESVPLGACDAKDAGNSNFVLRDVDGSLLGQGSGFVVMDTPQMTTFPANCISDQASCTAFCPGACLRTMALSVSTYESDDLELVIEDGTQSISILSKYDYPLDSNGNIRMEEHSKSHRNRLFFATLPSGGNYVAKFMLNGQDHWPIYVKQDYEDVDSDCPDFASFTVQAPPTSPSFCSELIQNGDMEDGITSWWATMGGVVSVDDTMGKALTSEYRTAEWMGPAQYFDTRCMILDNTYTVSANVKLVSPTTGLPVDCSTDSGSYTCPKIILKLESGAHQDRNEAWHLLGLVTEEWDNTGEWNTIQGSFTVAQHYVDAGSALIYFEAKEYVDALMVIDNVSVQLV